VEPPLREVRGDADTHRPLGRKEAPLAPRTPKRPRAGKPKARASDDDPATTQGAHKDWSCAGCGTTSEKVRYKSGKMANCYICQAYANAVINSSQKARKQAGITRKVDFTLQEFLQWSLTHPRRCRYCNIDDASYFALDYMTANGRRLEAIGLDRRNDGDYSLDNIDWCCYPCNRTKANSFTVEEMELLGPALELIWRQRLGLAAGFDPTARIGELVRNHRGPRGTTRQQPLEWQDPLKRVRGGKAAPMKRRPKSAVAKTAKPRTRGKRS
jgi:hypothetical protein